MEIWEKLYLDLFQAYKQEIDILKGKIGILKEEEMINVHVEAERERERIHEAVRKQNLKKSKEEKERYKKRVSEAHEQQKLQQSEQ